MQEEAPVWSVPVLVMRETTERPEGIEAGVSKLVGTDPKNIVDEAARLLSNLDERKMTECNESYGDGHAAERIADLLLA